MSSSPLPPSADINHNSDKVSSPISSSPTTENQNINKPTTPNGPKPPNPSSDWELDAIIDEHFPPFDHQANIVAPFNDEANRDLAFERDLSSMLLDALIETHAWASARPKHESTLAAQSVEEKIVSVIEAEKEQGMLQLTSLPPNPSSSSCVLSGIVGRHCSFRLVPPRVSMFCAFLRRVLVR
ncbi:hypothetical protein Hypma_014090 [Hypsizygus marmoreus]|uniref:Uncharacterized protein n=1 Tax=Hypsizygus marmoreus TaxID=39966 RepID=A0A369K678_HYPMA|nr:hypothetical protein Hypma_014090 [Hypsizygus marmoreus]